MPHDEEQSPNDSTRKPWFRANRSGVGWHPATWLGWLVLVIVIAGILTIVVLLRTGVL
jgi:hypothetical protein